MRNIFPTPMISGNWDGLQQRTVYQQTGMLNGADTRHLYLASILGGLASNPATMLDIEKHIEYAVKMAELADSKTYHW